MTRKSLPVSAVVAIVVVAAAGGWIAASQVRSPAEVAARTAPPEPSLITVPVESVTLVSELVVRGDILYDSPTVVSVSGSLGPEIESPVITALPQVGHQVSEGDVLIEVAGRPVFAISGSFPMYRALRPGSSGPDVRQLEEVLERLGHLDRPPSDTWNAATTRAVIAWHEATGYQPTRAGDDQTSEVWLPTGAIFVIDSLPVQVSEIQARIGQLSSTEILTLATPELILRASIPAREVSLVTINSEVLIDIPGHSDLVSGRVVKIADRPGTDGVPSGSVAVDIQSAALTGELVGLNLRVTLPIESTSGEVLAVPAAALSTNSRGESYVEVAHDGQTRLVRVEPGLAADGLVEVTPLNGHSIQKDERVVVGRDRAR